MDWSWATCKWPSRSPRCAEWSRTLVESFRIRKHNLFLNKMCFFLYFFSLNLILKTWNNIYPVGSWGWTDAKSLKRKFLIVPRPSLRRVRPEMAIEDAQSTLSPISLWNNGSKNFGWRSDSKHLALSSLDSSDHSQIEGPQSKLTKGFLENQIMFFQNTILFVILFDPVIPQGFSWKATGFPMCYSCPHEMKSDSNFNCISSALGILSRFGIVWARFGTNRDSFTPFWKGRSY